MTGARPAAIARAPDPAPAAGMVLAAAAGSAARGGGVIPEG